MVVVFPAPLGPRKPKVSPLLTSKSIPRTASSSPYFLVKPRRVSPGRGRRRCCGGQFRRGPRLPRSRRKTTAAFVGARPHLLVPGRPIGRLKWASGQCFRGA